MKDRWLLRELFKWERWWLPLYIGALFIAIALGTAISVIINELCRGCLG